MATGRRKGQAPDRVLDDKVAAKLAALTKNPDEVHLMCTTDGQTRKFEDDGADIRTEGRGIRFQPHARRQMLIRALNKLTSKKRHGVEGVPVFVAGDSIEGVYPGDPVATTDKGGKIPLLTPEIQSAIDAMVGERYERALQHSASDMGRKARANQAAAMADVAAAVGDALGGARSPEPAPEPEPAPKPKRGRKAAEA